MHRCSFLRLPTREWVPVQATVQLDHRIESALSGKRKGKRRASARGEAKPGKGKEAAGQPQEGADVEEEAEEVHVSKAARLLQGVAEEEPETTTAAALSSVEGADAAASLTAQQAQQRELGFVTKALGYMSGLIFK